jgi:tRNA-dihydrouridine synthase B
MPIDSGLRILGHTQSVEREAEEHRGELAIGPLHLSGRALLAPMAGVTDPIMRRIAARMGASLTVSEMVAAPGLSRGDAESALRAEADGVGPHAVQIAGCRPGDMADAARIAEACGADLIDINMGCPAKRVTGGLSGSALMRDLGHAVALIRSTVSAVDVPVTVKMRLGWDDSRLNAPELARRAEAEGVSLVTVHGRTRQQFYTGAANWRAVRDVVEAVSIPVVVNGDCKSNADVSEALAHSGARAVMIGRAAVGAPWLPGDVAHRLRIGTARPAPSPSVKLSVAQEHYEGLLHRFGTARGLRHARKHVAAYALQAPASPMREQWARRAVTSDNPHEVLALLKRMFEASIDGERIHACAA